MKLRMLISPLLFVGYWLWLLVGVTLAGAIWSLLTVIHYLTTRSEIGHGDGGMFSITQDLRPIGRRSLRMLNVAECAVRLRDSEEIAHGTRIYSSSDGLEPIHIMIIEQSEESGSGRKRGRGTAAPTSPRSSSSIGIYPVAQWSNSGSAS